MKTKKLFMALLAIGLLFTAYSCEEEKDPTAILKNQIIMNAQKLNITNGEAFIMEHGAEFMFTVNEESGMLHISNDLITGEKVDITTVKNDGSQFFDFSFQDVNVTSQGKTSGWIGWFKIVKIDNTKYNVTFEFAGVEHLIVGNFDAILQEM
ncbi:MAG: hypothetical protein BWY08_00088 [Bacteroidetes bacterium ADurb.Bin174]|nr:MAG: hypothetical protein BWY08_00088 [Bacteroidetes bacterium ADurb.Bin174]